MFAVKHGGYTLTYFIGIEDPAEALRQARKVYPGLNLRVELTTPEKEGMDPKAVNRNLQRILEGKLQAGPVPD